MKFKYTTEAVNALGRLLKAEPGTVDEFEVMETNVAAIEFVEQLRDPALHASFRSWIGRVQARHGLQ